MRLFSRLAVLAFPFALSACYGTTANSGSSAVPAAAAASSTSYAVPSRVLFHPLAFTPQAAQAILLDFVASGPAQNGLPCVSCVQGVSGGDNIGLSGPSNLVPKHATWQYAIAFTDVSFKGSCALTWTIANGAKTIDTFTATVKIPQAGGWYLYGTNRNPETYSGPATLTGKVACGSHKQSTSAPMAFQ